MRGTAAFVVVIALSAIACAAAFLAIASITRDLDVNAVLAGDLTGASIANLIALVSFVLGTAATLAGALASVVVANLALRLSSEAERREAVAFATTRIETASAHFARIVAGLNRLIGATGLLEAQVRAFARRRAHGVTRLAPDDAETLARAASGAGAQVADALERLAEAIEATLCDEFARFALQSTAETEKPGWLADLGHAFARTPQAGRPPSLHDLADFVARLRAGAQTLRADVAGSIATAGGGLPAALRRDPESHEILDRPATLFFFAGNLVDLRTGEIGDTGACYAVRAGAAMVADFAGALPNRAALRAACLQRYAEALPRRGVALQADFDPERAFSRAFRAALEDARGLNAPLGEVAKPPPA
jgi:hypothetical protein